MKNLALVALLSALITPLPGWSQEANQSTAVKQATVERRSVSLDAALVIARVALKVGKEKGSDVAVAVMDDAGLPLVVLRADNVTEHGVSAAESKAWTAVNFRASTRDLFEKVKKGEGADSQLPHIEKALFLMGGVPLKDGDTVVGGVGVGGCPHGIDDDAAAQAAAAKFAELLKRQ